MSENPRLRVGLTNDGLVSPTRKRGMSEKPRLRVGQMKWVSAGSVAGLHDVFQLKRSRPSEAPPLPLPKPRSESQRTPAAAEKPPRRKGKKFRLFMLFCAAFLASGALAAQQLSIW